MRYTHWPCLPVSTFPFFPAPLPSKWHIQFLAPLHVEQRYPPEAAEDRSVVKAIGGSIRAQMQQTMDAMVRQRRRVFWGKVFEEL